jgi:hypothetical protein
VEGDAERERKNAQTRKGIDWMCLCQKK